MLDLIFYLFYFMTFLAEGGPFHPPETDKFVFWERHVVTLVVNPPVPSMQPDVGAGALEGNGDIGLG